MNKRGKWLIMIKTPIAFKGYKIGDTAPLSTNKLKIPFSCKTQKRANEIGKLQDLPFIGTKKTNIFTTDYDSYNRISDEPEIKYPEGATADTVY